MEQLTTHNGYKVTYTKVKSILNNVQGYDAWFGLKYNMNLYRGCQHQCIYCDTRSECYRIADFQHEIVVKENALELLDREIGKKKVVGTIGFGSMNDCYMPIEKELKLARGALEIIKKWQLPVHVITKGNLVMRDIDLLCDINRVYAAVSFSITTTNDELGKKMEPFAATVSERFQALSILSAAGIVTGITMMPILPYITDTAENIKNIVTKARDCGAQYFIPSFAVTLRDRQRAYFYSCLDREFPGLADKYRQRFKNYYSCVSPDYKKLDELFHNECAKAGIPTRMPHFQPENFGQLKLF